ncbi:MAG: hypothetical protein ACI9MC_000305 [Kiritimatiellia bacterium]
MVDAHVGGVRVIDLRADGDVLVGMIQGHPTGGDQDLVLTIDGSEHVFANVVPYREAPSDLFPMVFMGASVSHGAQAGVPHRRSSLHSIATYVGRGLDVHIPAALLVEDLFPQIQPSDMGPAPMCVVPNPFTWAVGSLTDALNRMQGDSGTDMRLARVDPDIVAHVIAVPGVTLNEQIVAPEGFGERLMSHLIFDLDGSPADPVDAQLDRIKTMNAKVILAPDTLGNDVIESVAGEFLEPDEVRSAATLADDLDRLYAGLSDTGAHVFVGEAPNPLALPMAADAARRMRLAGHSEEDVAAAELRISQRVDDINVLVHEVADKYDNVHVFELRQHIDDAWHDGVQVSSGVMTTAKGGGLVSLDGLHFSDLGYAVVAKHLLHQLERDLGAEIVHNVDLDAVAQQDPYSPSALKASGFDASLCSNATPRE